MTKPKSKFKKGDKVRCIAGPTRLGRGGNNGRGHGWRLGSEFKIKRVAFPSDKVPVYFPTPEGDGTFEDNLELSHPPTGNPLKDAIERAVSELD